jgi:dTDP-4-amino-4,6-dideoxygalactose transaminase
VIRVPRRDSVRARLAEAGVGSEVYYPVPLHLQECFASLGGKPGDLPVSERAADEVLALPIWPELTGAEISAVAAAVAQAVS